MMKLLTKNEQRGTLMVEAIAMLGLIAMVTPTLYKKSAERLQEIQDINSASQARTMSNSMTAFINANYAALLSEMRDNSTDTIEVVYTDSSTAQNTFSLGYSSFLPYGYKPDEIRSFGEPRVFIHKDNTYVTSYVIYPKKQELGEKRSARLASLVGANGGLIDVNNEQIIAEGTGGAWYLDKDQLADLLKNNSTEAGFLKENSLIVTSEEPVSLSYDDNAQFLYRVPPDNPESSEYYHNTMVTDLYLGGYSEETDWGANANDYYSIFNVRKLTLNTDCRHRTLANGTTNSSEAALCQPNVADLYIGKPFSVAGRHGSSGVYGTAVGYGSYGGSGGMAQVSPNEGAAWIYGNLAALNSNFRLTHDGSWDRENGYDVMKFVRRNESSVAAYDDPWDDGRDELVVFEARNSDASAGVGFMNGFVQVAQGGSSGTINQAEFMVGRGAEEGADGAMLHIYKNGNDNWVHINKHNSAMTVANTYINENGGYVHINGGDGGSAISETYLNESGGKLAAGDDGDWLYAANKDNSAVVQILKNASSGVSDSRVFTVGQPDEDQDHMIYANKDKVSLRGGNLRVYGAGNEYEDSSGLGGKSGKDLYSDIPASMTGLTTVTSRDFDVLGRTYLGADLMNTTDTNDGFYNRALYTLGVAGSAWVDGLLWAREAWVNDGGFKNLNAGYSSLAEYRQDTHHNKAWLNVDRDRVLLRSRSHATGSSAGEAYDAIDTRLYADSTKVRIGDGGGYAHFEGFSARLGTDTDFVYAGSSGVYGDPSGGDVNLLRLQGSTYVELLTNEMDSSKVVDVQHGAMRFAGHADSVTGDDYENYIAAKAKYFTIKSGATSSDAVDDAQFMVGDNQVRVRYSDFVVEDDSSYAHFVVRPNVDVLASDEAANVMVDGSFHVTGNKVLHVAANSSQRAGSSEANEHAMLEIDPEYIQVWAKDSFGGVDDYASTGSTASGSDYYAMLKINPYDVHGGSSAAEDASIYIRKGAIELENSNGSSWAADEGFGYIKANRLVSGVDAGKVPSTDSFAGGHKHGTAYDMFMVNPAYTSVMHDIKLTTRGGARLSDILPDFVLKGVYNVSNDYVEEGQLGGDTKANKRIKASAGEKWCRDHSCEEANVAWASPFIGRIPFAQCPPGYQNMATMMPISFQIGQAGEVMQVSRIRDGSIKGSHGTFVVKSNPRQGDILHTDRPNLQYPGFYKVEDKQVNTIKETSTLVQGVTFSEVRGWFLGIPNTFNDSSNITDEFLLNDLETGYIALDGSGMARYTYQRHGETESYYIPLPLYFQQNTWLKTSLLPYSDSNKEITDGWDAFMGFVYNLSDYSGLSGEGFQGAILSNNTDGEGNDNGRVENVPATPDAGYQYVWNLFPIPTNSLEGHATVYCYFDRSKFQGGNWEGLVDQVDQINHYRDVSDRGSDGSSSRTYYERLNDPTLRYTDPW